MLWVLFTFPSRYLSTIGLGRVFSLGGWARRIHAGFHVPRATQDASRLQSASRTGLSPSAGRLSRRFRSPSSCHILVLQPRRNRNPGGLGCSPVAPDQRPLAPPRSFSQLAAPFIAFPSHRHPPCALSCFRLPRNTYDAGRIPWNCSFS